MHRFWGPSDTKERSRIEALTNAGLYIVVSALLPDLAEMAPFWLALCYCELLFCLHALQFVARLTHITKDFVCD